MHLLAAAVLTSWPTNTHVHLQYVYPFEVLALEFTWITFTEQISNEVFISNNKYTVNEGVYL